MFCPRNGHQVISDEYDMYISPLISLLISSKYKTKLIGSNLLYVSLFHAENSLNLVFSIITVMYINGNIVSMIRFCFCSFCMVNYE